MAGFASDEERVIPIASSDFRVKLIEMLQNNRALMEKNDRGATVIHFISDTGGVFDALAFGSKVDAEMALRRNGFRHFASSERLKTVLSPPVPPYVARPHQNGPIHSSGRFWVAGGR